VFSNISIWKLTLVTTIGVVFSAYVSILKYAGTYIDMYTFCITKEIYMNKDQQTFTDAMKHLVFLTTRDEYGSSRSRGIETLSDLATELNIIGIPGPRGNWTENSLKLHIRRLKTRYSMDELASACDLDFMGTDAWEYQSFTHHEEIVQKGKASGVWQPGKITQSYPATTYEPNETERWKLHEINDVVSEDIRIMIKSKNLSKH
jgi:hypothetical protein